MKIGRWRWRRTDLVPGKSKTKKKTKKHGTEADFIFICFLFRNYVFPLKFKLKLSIVGYKNGKALKLTLYPVLRHWELLQCKYRELCQSLRYFCAFQWTEQKAVFPIFQNFWKSLKRFLGKFSRFPVQIRTYVIGPNRVVPTA